MDLKCEEVLREISDYVDGDLEPGLSNDLTRHFATCSKCRSALDGIRNVVSLYGNEKLFAPSGGFDRRIHGWLANQVEGPKGSWWGWVGALGLAAAVLLLVLFADNQARPQLRAEMSEPARQVHQQLVAVVPSGKLFHDPNCPAIHGEYRMVTPEEAIREGYTPCTRCLGEDLRAASQPQTDAQNAERLAQSANR